MQDYIAREKKRVAEDCEDKEVENQWANVRKTDQRIGLNKFPSQRQISQKRKEKMQEESGAFVPWHDGCVGCNMPHPLGGFAL